MSRQAAALLAAALLLGAAPSPGAQAPAVDMQRVLDMAELEAGYDTIRAEYYRPASPQRLLDGARVGMVAYLRERGVAEPVVPQGRATGSYGHDLHELDKEYLGVLVRYGQSVDAHALIQHALAGELAALGDPYSRFFSPSEYHAFTSFLRGRVVGGIGVVVRFTEGRLVVERVFPQSPAQRAGLRAGDLVSAIDGAAVAGMTADAVGDRFHGDVGTTVRLSIVRDGAPLPEPVSVVRAEIHVPDVDGRMLDGGVGYIQLRSYGESAATDLGALVESLRAQGARALVLDLRDDGGGYENVAVGVTSKFVAAGPIVTIEDRRGRKTTHRADGSAVQPALPLAVLVNGNTASAAEITAAAIQDRGAGTIVGERTFGKGLVQQIFPLPDGSAMKLTTQRYLTANGRDIDRKGVTPDAAVTENGGALPGEPGRDAQLDRALGILGAAAPATPSPASGG